MLASARRFRLLLTPRVAAAAADDLHTLVGFEFSTDLSAREIGLTMHKAHHRTIERLSQVEHGHRTAAVAVCQSWCV